jgi:uncharacterized protein
VKSETDLGNGHCRLVAWVTGCLTAVALAAGGCGRGTENLAPEQAVGSSDQRLLQAAQEGNLGLIEAAVAAGANVNCRGTNGLTPLLQVLSAATAPLNAGQRRCIATLLERGAKPDVKDRDGRTPVIHAARLGDLETVRLLVETSVYLKAPDRFHKTALLYAAEGHHRDIVAYLAVNGDLQSPRYSAKKAIRN